MGFEPTTPTLATSGIASEDQIELKKRLATCILACATPGQLERAKLTEDGVKVPFDGLEWPQLDGKTCVEAKP